LEGPENSLQAFCHVTEFCQNSVKKDLMLKTAAEKKAHNIVLLNSTPDANDTEIARQAGVAACNARKCKEYIQKN
jgi:hypothetical protein